MLCPLYCHAITSSGGNNAAAHASSQSRSFLDTLGALIRVQGLAYQIVVSYKLMHLAWRGVNNDW